MIKGRKQDRTVWKEGYLVLIKTNTPNKSQTTKGLYTNNYLPIQKEEKISPNKSSLETGLVISPRAVCAPLNSSATNSNPPKEEETL